MKQKGVKEADHRRGGGQEVQQEPGLVDKEELEGGQVDDSAVEGNKGKVVCFLRRVLNRGRLCMKVNYRYFFDKSRFISTCIEIKFT